MNSRMQRIIVLTCGVSLALGLISYAQEKSASDAVKMVFVQGSPDEPLRTELSLAKAAESLDQTATAWVKKHKCGSCHTGWPYLGSRAVLKEHPGGELDEVRAFFEGRITNWEADEAVKKHQHREIVGTAAALAMDDARRAGKLNPVTRQALDRMWALQRKDGAWSWPKCSWPPFEVDDYYGAVLAAVGVGHAPDNYARSDAARAGVDKLRDYLSKTPAPNLHHRTWLLWAAARLDGLLGDEEKQATIRDLLSLQRDDGGWSMESLGKGWKGRDGELPDPDAPSDGYGTGLVVFVLREAGLPASHAALIKGVNWLRTNQRESGRWFTRSLNGVEQHYISDTATVFAVLALNAASPTAKLQAVDVLVIAPHPDDEVIGCGGVILRALEQKKRVAVVLLTSGDAHVPLTAVVAKKPRERLTPEDFKQAGALRQQHSLKAAARLGLAADDLTFLGYPDSGLEKIYQASGGAAFRQMFTQQSETYGIIVRDYHSRTHGGAAPYVKSSIHADLVEIFRARQPKEVYVTHEADTHDDHSAAFRFVRDALRESGFQGGFFTFLVHGKPPSEPPARELRLTPAELATKRAALVDHQAGTSPVHDNLAIEYAQPEERFWRAQLR